MDPVLKEIGNYFEERNRAWITGNIDALVDRTCGRAENDWILDLRHHIARKRQAMRNRNSQLLRSHSQISVRRLNVKEDTATAEVVEWVTWVYRDGLDFGTEARVIDHQQRWHKIGNNWCLVQSVETDEGEYLHLDDCSPSPRRDFHADIHDGMGGERPKPQNTGAVEDRIDDTMVNGALGDSATDGHENFVVPQHALGLPPGLPLTFQRSRKFYDRIRAQRYADLWWSSANPAFRYLQEDCTNFVSQCLYAADLPMDPKQGDRNRGWWYDFYSHSPEGWSYSWAVSHALYLYLTEMIKAEEVSDPQELNIGDLVFYDWDGSGHYQHTAIIADFDSQGDPLVNAHSVASFHRHYMYLDSRAWRPQTRYAYIHMPKQVGFEA